MIKVNKGVSELSNPAVALSMPVWARAKRKAGIKLPTTPEIPNHIRSVFLILGSAIKAKGSKQIKVITTRKAPTSKAEKYSNPLLMRMNELPHVNTNPTIISQENIFWFIIGQKKDAKIIEL